MGSVSSGHFMSGNFLKSVCFMCVHIINVSFIYIWNLEFIDSKSEFFQRKSSYLLNFLLVMK